jgi:hypothetical protein
MEIAVLKYTLRVRADHGMIGTVSIERLFERIGISDAEQCE